MDLTLRANAGRRASNIVLRELDSGATFPALFAIEFDDDIPKVFHRLLKNSGPAQSVGLTSLERTGTLK